MTAARTQFGMPTGFRLPENDRQRGDPDKPLSRAHVDDHVLDKETCADEARPSVESETHSNLSSIDKDVSISGTSERSFSGAGLTRRGSEVQASITSRRDVERGFEPPEKTPTEQDDNDADLVTWDGPDDPQNPKNWPNKKRWTAVVCVSFFTLISPVSSSMIAPALEAIGQELGISSAVERALSLSIFVLAYAVGPLFIGPMSELHGRCVVLQLSNLVYLVFNLACGLAQTKGQMIAFRFLSGLGGSAPLAIGGGVLSDLFTAEERGRAMSVYSLTPLLGPAIGPITGGYVAERASWRWVFHATTVADALIQLVGLWQLRETYAPVLLARKRALLVRTTGNARLRTPYDHPERTTAQTLRRALTRPFILLFTQPILQVLALYMMYLYGLIYLLLSTFPTLWNQRYGQSVGTGGLHYIALGVGFFVGAQVCARLQDKVYAQLKRHYGVALGRPEFRVPLMLPGAVLVPAGLLVYGWCAQRRTHWLGPDVGAAVFAAGTMACFQCIQAYLVDTYTLYAASALAAATVLRSLAGFGFPLFAPRLFERLDYGWGTTLLAALAVLIGWPAPLLLWRYGEALRARSPFAAGSPGL